MNLVYTLLVAFPLGMLVPRRAAALTAYLLGGAFLFTFQTAGLLLDYLAHQGRSAFGPYSDALPIEYSTSDYWGYGAVNLVITVGGIGLLLLGARVRERRIRRRGAVDVAASGAEPARRAV